MQIKSLFVLAFFAVLSFAQTTPAQVESDITNNISPKLSTALAMIEAFPTSGGTLDQAMAIHAANSDLNDAIVATANDINNASCPFSDSDGSAILALLEGLAPDLQPALMDIVAEKPDFDSLGVTSLIQQDLIALKASSDAMGAAFVGCVSSNIAPAAEEFDAGVDAAFAPVIAAFS